MDATETAQVEDGDETEATDSPQPQQRRWTGRCFPKTMAPPETPDAARQCQAW